ncbi:hypothetical protein EYF80_046231 [Liparis tanakae]|uniref:Uncharacterized protein n=1 Tax=Liparis tanakae TaxID=230148 RepID=A0A4Z2FQZ6_9TELE|nr:hypothetical protein EYF80_046231 [Liparis tanakae]
MRTLCLPMTKETLRLQGLTKLDQLVSMVTYSPFRAQKRIEEWSNGWPADCRTVGDGREERRGFWVLWREGPQRDRQTTGKELGALSSLVKEVVQRGDAVGRTLTFVTGVHPLGQQEAAELLLAQLGILDFHPFYMMHVGLFSGDGRGVEDMKRHEFQFKGRLLPAPVHMLHEGRRVYSEVMLLISSMRSAYFSELTVLGLPLLRFSDGRCIFSSLRVLKSSF